VLCNAFTDHEKSFDRVLRYVTGWVLSFWGRWKWRSGWLVDEHNHCNVWWCTMIVRAAVGYNRAFERRSVGLSSSLLLVIVMEVITKLDTTGSCFTTVTICRWIGYAGGQWGAWVRRLQNGILEQKSNIWSWILERLKYCLTVPEQKGKGER